MHKLAANLPFTKNVKYMEGLHRRVTRSLRKQAAYKQATWGPMALSPFQGTTWAMKIKCLAQGRYCRCQQIWTGYLMIEIPWSYPLSYNSSSLGLLYLLITSLEWKLLSACKIAACLKLYVMASFACLQACHMILYTVYAIIFAYSYFRGFGQVR